MSKTLPLAPSFLRVPPPGQCHAAHELADGLLQRHATVSPKFLYDKLGSILFDAITELPEYYPTRTEAAILARHLPEITAALPPGRPLVDLGAGDCIKASRLLLPLQVSRYLAIDISEAYLRQSLTALQARFPSVPMVGVGMDFSQHLALPPGLLTEPALLFYPGSSIGNFAPAEALTLLMQAQQLSQGAALLIGVDLFKPAAILEDAYDDATDRVKRGCPAGQADCPACAVTRMLISAAVSRDPGARRGFAWLRRGPQHPLVVLLVLLSQAQLARVTQDLARDLEELRLFFLQMVSHLVRQFAGLAAPGLARRLQRLKVLHQFVHLVVLGQRMSSAVQAHVVHQHRHVEVTFLRCGMCSQLLAQLAKHSEALRRILGLRAHHAAAQVPLLGMAGAQLVVDVVHGTCSLVLATRRV